MEREELLPELEGQVGMLAPKHTTHLHTPHTHTHSVCQGVGLWGLRKVNELTDLFEEEFDVWREQVPLAGVPLVEGGH